MKLHFDGHIDFASIKELYSYIKAFDEIECERDLAQLDELIAMWPNFIEPPKVIDGSSGVYVEKGEIDDYCFHDKILEYGACVEAYIKIGEYEFTSSGSGRWFSCDFKRLKELPVGFTDDELDMLLEHSDGAQDEFDLLFEALEAACSRTAFSYDYRDFVSEADDIEEIEQQLGRLQYDGYYVEDHEYEWPEGVKRVGHRVHGWKRSDDIDIPESSVMSIEKAAIYLAEEAGIIEIGDKTL